MHVPARGVAAASLLGALALASPAQATQVIYLFNGLVTAVDADPAQSTFAVGQSVSGSWLVDGSVAPQVLSLSAIYEAVEAFQIIIGPAYASASTGGAVSVSADGYSLAPNGLADGVEGLDPLGPILTLAGRATPFPGPIGGPLPLELDLADFASAGGTLTFQGEGFITVEFAFTDLTGAGGPGPVEIPAPAPLALLGLGLLGLAALRRTA
jgi:hypothetical protein